MLSKRWMGPDNLMKLLCLTDIHGDRSAFRRILRQAADVEAILLGGDITNFGTPDAAEEFVRHAREHCSTVLAVAGNCDSAAIDDRLAKLGVSLFRRGVEHHGIGFYGVSAMPPWYGNMYELTEDQIADALETGRAHLAEPDREVVLSHAPPRGTLLDRTRRGAHVGSTAVRKFIETAQPTLVVSGHIHESRGSDRIGRTTIVNCGPAFRGYYAVVDIDEVVQVDLRTV